MKRWATASLAALMLIAGSAAADENDARWQRSEARARDYQARTWVRLRDGGERYVWVDAASAAGLKRRAGRPRKVLVLYEQDLQTHVAHVGTGVAYTIAETTLHCRDHSATEHRFHFGSDHHLMAETAPVREEVAADDLLFEMVCEGANVRESVRKETAEGVVNYEAAGQTDGPAAPE